LQVPCPKKDRPAQAKGGKAPASRKRQKEQKKEKKEKKKGKQGKKQGEKEGERGWTPAGVGKRRCLPQRLAASVCCMCVV
jgi:hypothetical protein